MNEQAARHLIERSLDIYFSKDASNLPPDIGERCIAHRIAMYMEKLLRDDGLPWSVDCEYNRNGQDPKRVPLLVGLHSPDNGRRRGDATPDIIVHRRGEAGPNLNAIEVKRLDDDLGDDELKLRGYRLPPLNYKHAFHLRIALDRQQCRIDSVAGPEGHCHCALESNADGELPASATAALTPLPVLQERIVEQPQAAGTIRQ